MSRDWRTFGASQQSSSPLFVEMYGFSLTIYVISGWLQSRHPGLGLLSHNTGHLWSTLTGEQGDRTSERCTSSAISFSATAFTGCPRSGPCCIRHSGSSAPSSMPTLWRRPGSLRVSARLVVFATHPTIPSETVHDSVHTQGSGAPVLADHHGRGRRCGLTATAVPFVVSMAPSERARRLVPLSASTCKA